MSVYPPVLDSGQDAIVSYYNVPNPNASDYITVSCGPTNGMYVCMYVCMHVCNPSSAGISDYLDMITVPSPVSQNNSVMFLNLFYMRCNYTYVWYGMVWLGRLKRSPRSTMPTFDRALFS